MLNHNQMVPFENLYKLAEEQAETYKTAKPFAHGYYDDVFPEELLDGVIEEFELGEKQWREFESKYEKKLQMNQDCNLQPITRALIHNLNSEPFLKFLTKLTGIEGLIPDPYLVGGGLHKIERGGKLGVHVDFNVHEVMAVTRRLNVLVYLNKDWLEEWGGHFELWDADKKGCEAKFLPLFNRMAIFTTTSTSFHGHPVPLNCPEDRCRMSLALYYYTANDRGGQEKKPHSTQFLSENGTREELKADNSLSTKVKRKIKKMIGRS